MATDTIPAATRRHLFAMDIDYGKTIMMIIIITMMITAIIVIIMIIVVAVIMIIMGIVALL